MFAGEYLYAPYVGVHTYNVLMKLDIIMLKNVGWNRGQGQYKFVSSTLKPQNNDCTPFMFVFCDVTSDQASVYDFKKFSSSTAL